MESKVCSVCNRELNLAMFSKSQSGKNGLNNKCKDCVNEYSRIYNKEHYIYDKEKASAKYNKNRTVILEKANQYYKDNKDKVLKISKQYNKDNKEKLKKYAKEYNIENKKMIADRGKKYRISHKVEIKERYNNSGEHDKDYREKQRLEIETSIKEKYKNKFIILTHYINGRTKVLIKCLVCENEYSITGQTLNNVEHSCIKCKEIKFNIEKDIKRKAIALRQKNRIKTDDYIDNEIKTLTNGEYKFVGHYEKCNIPIAIKHIKCGNIFKMAIGDFVGKGCRCPQCYIKNRCKELGIPIEQWGHTIKRNGRALSKWGNKVKRRDKYKCVLCGSNVKLNAHHLNAYGWDIENRSVVANGVTLCERCHTNFHVLYGHGGNTKEQFEKFKKPIQLTLAI